MGLEGFITYIMTIPVPIEKNLKGSVTNYREAYL